MKLILAVKSIRQLSNISQQLKNINDEHQISCNAGKLNYDEVNETDELVSTLKQFGFHNSDVCKKHPWLRTMKVEVLREKLRLISMLNMSHDTVELLKLTIRCLEKVTEQWQRDKSIVELQTESNNRLEYFARLLQCSVGDLMKCVSQHYPILTFDFYKIVRVIELLHRHGISSNHIMNDLWIIRHNEEVIQSRLFKLKQADVAIKTWMLRCPELIFNNHLTKETNAKVVLGEHDDLVSYLADRLDCSSADILALSKRHPRLLSINLPKIKMVLDFVYDQGFTSAHVMSTPRIFSHSLDTIKQRLKELNELNFHPLNLHILCCTVKEHQQLILKITKAKRT